MAYVGYVQPNQLKFKLNSTTMLTDQNHEAAPGFCAPSMPLWNCTYLWIYNKRWHEPNLITHDPETMFFWIYFTILESKRTKKT